MRLECQYCHKIFDTHTKTRKYCSIACRNLAYVGRPNYRNSNRIDVTCECCGKVFKRTPSSVRSRVFCSRECRKNAPPKSNPTLVLFKCVRCGKDFSRRKGGASPHTKNRLCSRECFHEWAKENKKLKHDNPNFTSVEVHCAECGKTILRPPYRAKDDINNFCDMVCYGEWRSKNITGEAHPIWKGGDIYYYGPNWQAQAAAARKRDGYCCQHCGMTQKKHGRKLDVHHIKPFREFGYVFGENDNYKQANELTNLITYCIHCHKLAEHGHIPIQQKLVW